MRSIPWRTRPSKARARVSASLEFGRALFGSCSEQPIDEASVGRIADDQWRAEHRAAITGREIVEDHDPLAVLDELANDVTADVAGTAGDEDAAHGRNASSRPGP